jgi:hypothetical protein
MSARFRCRCSLSLNALLTRSSFDIKSVGYRSALLCNDVDSLLVCNQYPKNMAVVTDWYTVSLTGIELSAEFKISGTLVFSYDLWI